MYQLLNTRDDIVESAVRGRYRVMTWSPDGGAVPPDEGWPVIYLLDGAKYFSMAASVMASLSRPRCGITPGIVVGIDYVGTSRRDKDYRPAVAHRVLEPNPQGGYYPAGMAGDAAGFRRFLIAELKPMIAARYPIDLQREALFGHSYGGLFSVDTLFWARESFQHYYACSPSVWWNGEYILRQAASLNLQTPTLSPVSLMLSVGEYEQSLEPWERGLPSGQREILREHRRQRRMVDGVRELALILKNRAPEVDVSLQTYPGQSHHSVPFLALHTALRHHFQPT
ncbi:alpha/beta hydrolase [Lonsdalea britannica]|uniref:alpha/beta hydrolase n=1 Tax=Lonsdalea britannica TaxID=1082704 RepID=UPI0026EA8702|nr:alpha/beta hydrolase-fold protein [Lonsdalea britannica]